MIATLSDHNGNDDGATTRMVLTAEHVAKFNEIRAPSVAVPTRVRLDDRFACPACLTNLLTHTQQFKVMEHITMNAK